MAKNESTVTQLNALGTQTNLLITLDISGSMVTTGAGNGMTRLGAAKEAILDLISQYQAMGNVKIDLVTFRRREKIT